MAADALLSAIRHYLELRRLKKRWRKAYEVGRWRTQVISKQMDPTYTPPSGSMNPNGTHVPLHPRENL